MTVLYIIDPGTVGGATKSFLEMVMLLKDYGITPIVLTSRNNDINQLLTDKGINSFAIGHTTVLTQLSSSIIKRPLSWVKQYCIYHVRKINSLKKVDKIIRENKIDLIHTNSARNDIGCYISKKYNIPHIMHIREFSDLDFGCVPLDFNYIKIYNAFTNRFITISDAIKKHWEKKGILYNKMLTIYNGIHSQKISVSSDSSKENEKLKMVIVGGVYPTKGQHLAVEAICNLPNTIRQNIFLDIIGWYSKEYVTQIKNIAEKYNVLDHIKFLGKIDNVSELLGNYQIGLMCSKSEGFGRSTAEYMHAQLGVIASNSGACPELVEPDICGQLFESGNAKDLACCIERYYNNRDLLIKHSHAARKKAQNQYTDVTNAQNIYKLYKEVLHGVK